MYGFPDGELDDGTENTTLVPLEASTEPPTKPTEDDTSTPTDTPKRGSLDRLGNTIKGSDTDSLQSDPIDSKPTNRPDSLPHAALHQPTSTIAKEELLEPDAQVLSPLSWPELLGPDAQVPHDPARKFSARTRKEPADTPMVLPMGINPALQLLDSAKHSAEPDIVPNEDTDMAKRGSEPTISETATNAPPVGRSTTAYPTSTRRQRLAKRLPKSDTDCFRSKSDTACFSWDTFVLIAYQDSGLWKKFYQIQRGELVVQSLPSGNIMDLTGALLTSVKTTCCFDTKKGGNDMVHLGMSTITPNHHVQTADGWMTASQAADKGLGVVQSSPLERVYNLCLVGGGNILINTSSQPEVMIFTPAATMRYLFTPASGSQHHSSLSYPEDIQLHLGRRQDFSFGYARFGHGDVMTLPNGGLIFANATGDLPQKKARALQLDKSPGDNQLNQTAPQSSTALKKKHNCGPTAHDHREKLTITPPDVSPLCSRSIDGCGDPVRLNQGCLDSIVPSHSMAETLPTPVEEQEYRLIPSFTSDTHILLFTAGVASWTQIRDIKWGSTVIQSLPSGNIGDVRRAQLATLEKVWYFETEGDDFMVQIGKAHLTANHPILTPEGWLPASQAAAQGYGLLSSAKEFSHLCGLQLSTGGNILINTPTTHDLASVYIEAATQGYSSLSSPTYTVPRTGPRHGSAGPTKPSYAQATSLQHKGGPERPILLLSPGTHAPPKAIADLDATAKGHTEETSIFRDGSRSHHEQTSRAEAMGTGRIDGAKGARGGSEESAADVFSQRDTTDTTNTTSHGTPTFSTSANSVNITHPQSEGSGTPDTYSDILIQTPKGEGVPEHEIRWGLNPYSVEDGDSSQLLEIEPGHHIFRPSRLAISLCKMVGTDSRSQFYKSPAMMM